MMDEHCKLRNGEIFQDYDCLLNCVEEKSDKFYRIQLLMNDEGFHVWTRWGRNGTEGQSKLEGPISQTDAVKNFQKKFMEKSKNSWNEREQFKAVKGKYTLMRRPVVVKTLQKPDLPAELVSNMQLPVDVLYNILSHLSLREVLRCMQVCKAWKILLNEKYFWKMYIQGVFDLKIKSDFSDEGPMAQWSNPNEWFCYFEDDVEKDDIYVMCPFPSIWNCGVVHPHGLDPLSGDVKTLQGLCRSLEILVYMRSESSRLGMSSGSQCSANEGQDGICVVLFPWFKEDLPTPLELLNEVFHFHPEIFEYYTNHPNDKGELRKNKLHFHLVPDNIDDLDYEEEEEHDLEEQPCLNRIFGMDFPDKDTMWMFKDSQKFYEWLQPIMYPSLTVYAGEDKLNPVAVFMVTHLAPGWVGGALTAVNYT